jgi:hypothetical protein
MKEALLAFFITNIIFIGIFFVRHYMDFRIYLKVSNDLLYIAGLYLKGNVIESISNTELEDILYRRVEKIKMRKWIDFIKVRWESRDKLVMSIKFNFNSRNSRVYSFSLDVKRLIASQS